MKTPGQIEAFACGLVNEFFKRCMGRGASIISASLAGNALFIHLRDVLTPAELSLASPALSGRERGASMVREIRDHIVREGRGELAATLGVALGRRPESVLHDVDPDTGDEVIVFTFGGGVAPTAPGRASRRG